MMHALHINKVSLLLPLSIPLFTNSSAIYELYEHQLFYLVFAVLIVTIMSMIFVVGNRAPKCSLNPLDVMVTLFYFVALISNLINHNDFLLNDEGFILITALVVLYFIVKISFFTGGSFDESLLRTLFWTMLSVSSLEAVSGILQNYSIDLVGTSGLFKVVGTFYNPNQYASFVSPSIPIGLVLYFSEEKLFAKRLAIVIVLLIIFILPATLMRSAWLAVIIGGGVFTFLKYRHKLQEYFHTRKYLLLASFALAIVVLVAVILLLYKLRPASADARILVWKVTKQMIASRPIFGCGFGNYGIHYMDYQARFFRLPENIDGYAGVAGNMKIADNDFVQIAAELGIVGGVIFLTLLFMTYFKSFKKIQHRDLIERRELYLIGTIGSLTTFLVISFFSFPLHIAPTAIIFSYLLAITSGIINSDKNIQKQELKHSQRDKWVSKFASIFMVVVMVFISWNIPGRIISYKVWDDAFVLSLNGAYDDAISLYKSVYKKLEDNGKFHFMLGGTYVAAGTYKEGICELEKSKKNYNDPEIYIALGTAYEKLGDSANAIADYREASYMMPQLMYPHFLMAQLYYKDHDMVQAQREAQAVVNMPIKIESQAVDEMKSEMSDLEKKIELLKQ